MKDQSPLFTERHMRYIQRALHVSRQELIETIRRTQTSAEHIYECLLKRENTNGHKPDVRLEERK